MRNRLNEIKSEGKTHYKLYKSGRRWVIAGITAFSVGIGLTFSQVGQAKAATNSDTDETENSANVSSNSPAETKNAVVLKSSRATVTADTKDVSDATVSGSTASDDQPIAAETTATGPDATGSTASESAPSGTTSNAASNQESRHVGEATDNTADPSPSSSPMPRRVANRAISFSAPVTDDDGETQVDATDMTATVTYYDETSEKNIKTEKLHGAYGTTDAYRTADTIATYESAGYDLVRDEYPTDAVVYDQDGIVQAYTVTLKHKFVVVTPDNPGTPGQVFDPANPDGAKYPAGTAWGDLIEQVSRTIQYLYKNGSTAKPDNVQAVKFSRNATVDEVTGTVVYTDWLTADGAITGRFEAVDSPVITGYTADSTSVAGNPAVVWQDDDTTIVVTYTAVNTEKATATVTYVDATTGAVLATVSLTGSPNTPSDYRTATAIAAYVKQGYELVSDDYPASGESFSEGGANYTVRLAHATDTMPETKIITQTVHYQANNGTPLHTDTISTITFTRTKVVDQVTGTVTYSGWSTSKDGNTFASVPAITIPGYHPSVTGTQAVTVTPDSTDDVQTIDYVADTVTIKTPDQPVKVKKSQKKQKKVVQVKQLKKSKQPVQMVGATAAALGLRKTSRTIKQTKGSDPATTHKQTAAQKRMVLPQTNDDQQASVVAKTLGLLVATLLIGLSAIFKRRRD
ncbi:mucin-binding protein [Levilactobacillus brevis]|uniref:mucin-binding protein n=1 Tax=Levilactobacillus brevis TaxID=1580 RepID=UPI0021A40C28|nr:KxYKxGKxW signal peptide domain-containing protein [Levilactobacillus brevis]